MVTEVKLHCFRGRGSTNALAVNFFFPFLNEFGNSKLHYLIFHHGITTAMETESYFHHHESAADDLVDWDLLFLLGCVILPKCLRKSLPG